MLNQAIMQSMLAEKDGVNQVTQEPLNPEQRKREDNVPCGLKNIGNTCYFNSILQVYYNIPEFVQAILNHKDDDIPLKPLRKAAENK
jgi:ubiquitin carboxyl-terminal hydrolase 25/28